MLKNMTKLLGRIRDEWKYGQCYNRREDEGVAVFKMCYGGEYPSDECKNCPFYVDVSWIDEKGE